MHGDRVLVRIARIEAGGRADGEIVKVLKRAHPTVVGEFRIHRRGKFVVPQDDRIQQWIEIPEGMAIPAGQARQVDRIGVEAAASRRSVQELDGMIVNAEMLEYPETASGPVGRVIEILGRPDDFGIDVEIVIRKHHLPHQFPAEVVEQAQSIPADHHASAIWQAAAIFATWISSPSTAKPRAISTMRFGWTASPNGNYALQVHIADVSHYVRPASPIDGEARLRGTSVYFPDRAVPMLPFELSTNICSLVPQADRLVLSALLEIDRQGDVVAQEFMPRRDPQRGAHDLHERASAARRRCRAARPLRAAGGALRADAGAGADSATASAYAAAPSISTCPSR